MHHRTQQLIALMERYDLSDADVAAILGCSATTVSIWRCKNPARVIPETSLRLLTAELLLRAGQVQA